jgi:hypothetical protein
MFSHEMHLQQFEAGVNTEFPNTTAFGERQTQVTPSAKGINSSQKKSAH